MNMTNQNMSTSTTVSEGIPIGIRVVKQLDFERENEGVRVSKQIELQVGIDSTFGAQIYTPKRSGRDLRTEDSVELAF